MISNHPESRPPARALALFSGGLDSQLAVCLLRAQGVAVAGIAFISPFFNANAAVQAAQQLDLPLQVEDFTLQIVNLLDHPPHGFGSGLNPCIDCHAAMFRQAGAVMRARGFDCLVSGEVLNQRPMSQNRRALQIVARDSGCAEVILRPLSARLLPPTLPENLGLVDRGRLLALEGRNRKPQMALAANYGIRDYPQPAGGCLLTDRAYGRKLKELRDHEGLRNLDLIRRLQTGRHFRLPAGNAPGGLRLIIGRNQEENRQLERGIQPGETLIRPATAPGAAGLLAPGAGPAEISLAAAVCARYSDYPPGQPADMVVQSPGEAAGNVAVAAAAGGN